MLAARIHLPACAALLTAITVAVPRLAAQVPEGCAVVGTNANPTVPGTPGLFLVPLPGRATAPMVRISGVPPSLRYAGGGFRQGVASVSYRSADGAIIVGTVAQAGGPTAGAVELYVLHLNNTAVDPARTRSIQLATTTNTGGVWNTLLPDGKILVAGGQVGGPFTRGRMAGHLFAIVDTSGPTLSVTLLRNPTIAGGTAGGFAVDPTGKFLYAPATTNINSSSRVAYLYRMEFKTNQARSIASWPGQVAQGVFCDDDGTVYLSATDPTTPTHFVHTVRPDGWNAAKVTTQQSSLALVPSGLDLDRASGKFVAASAVLARYSGPQVNALSLIDHPTPPTRVATVTVIASPPPGGWGVIARQGVAVNNAIESYGASSDAQSQHHWFENFPNPGGQPTVPNPTFSLTLRSDPAGPPAPSILALSGGRGSTALLGAEILVDLASMVTVDVPHGQSVTYRLPIPNNPGLRGTDLTAQSVHVDPVGGGLVASRGLTLSLR